MAEADEAARDAGSTAPAVAPAPQRSPRLAVPLMLAAGWGALFSYSLTYLMDDAPRDAPPRERGVAAEAAAFDPPGDLLRPTGALPGRPRWREYGSEAAAADPGPRVVPVSLSQDGGAASPTVVPGAVRTERAPVARGEIAPSGGPRLDRTHAEPTRNETPRRDVPRAEYAGVWGPTAVACGTRSRRRGYLPATITDDGAKAGRTLCRFRNGRRDGSAWVVAADCTERGRSWTSQVRLLVEGDRLTWTSAKGTSAYVRCGRRDG